MTPLFKISLHNLGEHYAGQRHFAKSFGSNSLGKSHADQQRFAKLFGWNDLKISLHNLGEHYAGQRHFAKSFGWNSLGEKTTPHEDLKVVTESTMLLKPGTTMMITSNLSPAPYVPGGLYTVKGSNLVQLTMRNTDICPLTLQKNEPITGITVHLLDQDYYKEAPLPKDAIRTYFLSQEIIKNTPDPTHNGDESATKDTPPKQHLEDIQRSLQHAMSLLEAAGLHPPGIRGKPLQDPSPEVSRILLEQFDNKDVEQAGIPAYKQPILDSYDVFSLDKFDVGHTPHYHHKITHTTDQPMSMLKFKVPLGPKMSY